VAQGEGPEFKLQDRKKKKKNINSNINRKREEKPMDVGKAFGKI
jgi:hypothetical protein